MQRNHRGRLSLCVHLFKIFLYKTISYLDIRFRKSLEILCYERRQFARSSTQSRRNIADSSFVLKWQYKCDHVGWLGCSVRLMHTDEGKMVQEPKRSKTESLSLRLDPKTKFILDFVARINGQSITTVVERAIKIASQNICVNSNSRDSDEDLRNWMHFWDSNEAIRTLKLISDSDYPTTFEEDEILSFVRQHWQFFYTSPSHVCVRSAYVQVLWPSISRYMEIWRSQKAQDWWVAGRAMATDLAKAKISGPEWPPKAKEPPPKSSPSSDLDD